jgi:hypothetical protein
MFVKKNIHINKLIFATILSIVWSPYISFAKIKTGDSLVNKSVLNSIINNTIKNTINSNYEIKQIDNNLLFDLSLNQIALEYAPSDAASALIDSAKNVFENLKQSNNWVSTISEDALIQLPLGLKKKIGGTDYQVAFANIEFGINGGRARVFGKTTLPQNNADGGRKELYFSGFVNLSRVGGIISDGKIQLIGDDAIKSSGDWSLSLKGNNPSRPSKLEDQTYLKFDCTGFVELGIKGSVQLSKDVFLPITKDFKLLSNPAERSAAPVDVITTSFSNLIIDNLKFTHPFKLRKVNGYAFLIEDAVLDFSDTKNPEGSTPEFNKYLRANQPDEPKTWQGVLIKKIQVFLPQEYKYRSSKDHVTFSTNYGIIDATGFSTNFKEKNVLKLDEGLAGLWKFRVEEFGMTVKSSEFKGGSIIGEILLPIQSKEEENGLKFKGVINENGEYEVNLVNVKSIIAPFWKAKINVDKSSIFSLVVKNGDFYPKVNLSGKIAFNTNGNIEDAVDELAFSLKRKNKTFSVNEIDFEELQLQNEKPFLQVKAMGAEGKLHIASFESEYSVSVSTNKKTANKNKTTSSNIASLDFAVDIKFMEDKIGGKGALSINASYDEKLAEWNFENVSLSNIGIKADFGKAEFDGEVSIIKNDENYGDAFAGSLRMKVHKFLVDAKGIFGVKDGFRYWSVDALAKGFKIKAGMVVFKGFAGGVSYKMKLSNKQNAKSPSGILYVPSNNDFLQVRAGVLFDIVNEKVMTVNGRFAIDFNNKWGVNKVSIGGAVRIFTNPANKSDAEERLKEDMLSYSTKNKTINTEDAAIWGDVLIELDIENDVYTGNLNAYVNFKDIITGRLGRNKAGAASFYSSNTNWNILIGTQDEPLSLHLSEGPFSLNGDGYFMMSGSSSSFSKNLRIKHGLSLWYDVKYHKFIVYAKFGGGIKYDIALIQQDNFTCNGKLAGIHGWYGAGRVQAYLTGGVGIDGIGDVFSGSISADLEVRGPNPMYFNGEFKGRYSVGWWIFKVRGSFTVEFEKGTYCALPN